MLVFRVTIVLALLLVCALFAAVLRKLVRRLDAAYRYDVRRDFRCDFAATGGIQLPVILDAGNLHLPAEARTAGALFLGLQLRSTLLGRLLQPRLAVTAGGRCRVQSFERGARGLRYLNLSSLDRAQDGRVRLRGWRLRIPSRAMLHCVATDLDPARQRILIISPHPDDAEIAAFGLYYGRDAYIVTVTAGEAGEPGAFQEFGATAYLEKGHHRVWNSLTVPMLGGIGVGRTANLGYFDSTLAGMRALPEVPVRSVAGVDTLEVFRSSLAPDLIVPRRGPPAWGGLVDDMRQLLQRIQPDIVVAPYPRIDLHPDHKLSTVALLEAIDDLEWTRGSLLLYCNHLAVSDVYPYGARGGLVSLPPGFDDLYFDGILSTVLDDAMQARKYRALEAMIDIRPVLRPETLGGLARLLLRSLKARLTDADASYLRLAVRSDELLFQVRMERLSEPGVRRRIEGDLPLA